MKRKLNVCFSVLTCIILAACSPEMKEFENTEAMVADAMSDANIINLDDFKIVFDHQEVKRLIVDCREESEFIEGHIPGAINVPRGMIGFSKQLTDRRIDLFVYSQTSDRAALAYASLKKLKFTKMEILDGGWNGWTEAYPELKEEGSGAAVVDAPEEEASGGCGD